MLTSLAYPSRLLSLSLIFLPLPLSPCNICHIYLITSLRSHLYDIFNLESRTCKFCSLCQLCIIASALLSARLNYSNSRSTSSKSGGGERREVSPQTSRHYGTHYERVNKQPTMTVFRDPTSCRPWIPRRIPRANENTKIYNFLVMEFWPRVGVGVGVEVEGGGGIV